MSHGSFWERFRFKFRISVQNEDTLSEVWHIRLSRLGLLLGLVGLSVLTFFIFASLIWFTPIRRYLPGYNENIRQTLIEEIVRIDSLKNKVDLQDEYVGILRNIVSGEIKNDSTSPLDSITLMQREQILAIRSSVTEEFEAEYEAQERDNLTLFDMHQTAIPKLSLFRPVRGVIENHFNLKEGKQEIEIRSPKNEPVVAVLAGTVVYLAPSLEHEYIMMIQHDGEYLSIYKNISKPLKHIGEIVTAGETIAFADQERAIIFSLWQKGIAIDPEEVIVF